MLIPHSDELVGYARSPLARWQRPKHDGRNHKEHPNEQRSHPVDQDKLGIQGSRVGPLQIWVKPISGGARAVALFNFVTDDVPQPILLRLKDVGFQGPVHARDLWAHKDLGLIHETFTVTPPA
jgi:hypothetical protein